MSLKTELRVGNLVKDRAEPRSEFCEIALDDFACMGNFERSGVSIPYSPIPLTEEWLLRFGFRNSCIYYSLNRVGGEYYEDVFHINFNGVEYDYHFVHQLQNLYFALTGKELEYEK